ncbi:MAG: C40 family peptidase [Deltaproteobacteria bacterium]|nr:C40 family peptidase [Deltaproteobacteria bacterium]
MRRLGLLVFPLILVVFGCAGTPPTAERPVARPPVETLRRLGYSIQVGAFLKLDNAVRLTGTLQDRGLGAYYFLHKSGLFKVRFGDFPSRAMAREKAEQLKRSGTIHDYYIVGPEDYPRFKDRRRARSYLRNAIVSTAKTFVGLPYRYGGASPEHGFDCSGLSMAVYRLNGLDLPRTSREQWEAGTAVSRKDLSKGDLVFFSTSRRRRISHVGIYVGGGRFIHAPGTGKKIRFDSLSSPYFKRRYAGGRTYL